jgi:hypothetical protein
MTTVGIDEGIAVVAPACGVQRCQVFKQAR